MILTLVELTEVNSRRDLVRFVEYPFHHYRNERHWVPPLISDEIATLALDKNPAFEHCEARYWLVSRAGRIVGRIAGIVNHRHEARWGQHYARFGWVEFEDDPEVSSILLNAVEEWARSRGASAVHGPLGFSDMDRQGLLVDGFDHMASLTSTFNYSYYPSHFERLGYQKDVDWIQLEAKIPPEVPSPIRRVANRARRNSGLLIPSMKTSRDLRQYAPAVFELMNRSYFNLYSYVALTPRQVTAYCNQYFSILDPSHVSLAIDTRDNLAGFAIAVPWLSDALRATRGRLFPLGWLHLKRALTNSKRAELCLVACDPAYEGKGAYALLADALHTSLVHKGVESAETSLMLEHNHNVLGLWKHYNCRVIKRKRCYIKRL